MTDGDSLTERLRSLVQGEGPETDALFEEIMPQLKKIAASALRGERHGGSLTRTELVQEIWLRHLRRGIWTFEDRRHFYLLVGRAMRQVLVDEARRRLAEIRGGRETILSLGEDGALPEVAGDDAARAERILEVDRLLERLEAEDPDAVRIVELCHLSGCTVGECAKETGLTVKQVHKRLKRGMKWLRKRMGSKVDLESEFPGL